MVDDFKEFNLNDRQIDALLKMNNENMSFTYKSYENQYDISKSTAKRDLSNLMSHNLIRRIIIDQTYYFMI
nr:DeoR family transcriptional regulator [Methanobrevibacter oralis]